MVPGKRTVHHACVVPRFSVLASTDGVRALVQESAHEDAARRCGFTRQVWEDEAVSYRAAYEAWKSVGDDPLNVNVAGAVNPPDLGLDSLNAAEIGAVRDVVHALVERERATLEAVGAFADGEDPYMWTAPYGRWDRVDLMVPPGPPELWRGDVFHDDSRPGWAAVIVDLWTWQEGPSDLSLELELETTTNGAVVCTFQNLHVM